MPRKSKNPLHSIELRVSLRDRQIYRAVVIEQRTQTAVANEHNITQSRVSAIIKRVRKWRALPVPPGMEEFSREEQLRVAGRDHRERLGWWYEQAVGAWQSSKTAKHKVKMRMIKGEQVEERIVELRDGDARLFKIGLLAADKIVQFEGFDLNGNVDVSCTGRVFEPPKMTDVELNQAVKKKVMCGDFDTPGDEGVPGLWGAEVENRNAEVKLRAEQAAAELRANELAMACVGQAPACLNAGDSSHDGAAHCDSGANQLDACSRQAGACPTVADEAAVAGEEELKSSSAEGDKVLCEKRAKTAQDTQEQVVTSHTKNDHLLYNDPPPEGEAKRPAGAGQRTPVRYQGPATQLVRGFSVPIQFYPDDPAGVGQFRWSKDPPSRRK